MCKISLKNSEKCVIIDLKTQKNVKNRNKKLEKCANNTANPK